MLISVGDMMASRYNFRKEGDFHGSMLELSLKGN